MRDPFYSNEDIAVLHSVITTAQDLIDRPQDPKPLPVTALFKAYDQVLPRYGIDPDIDQHLSAFVFKVGGEGGKGTLLEKFLAILRRMGIMLEFGDHTTTSVQTSSSRQTGSHSTRPVTSVPPVNPREISKAQPSPIQEYDDDQDEGGEKKPISFSHQLGEAVLSPQRAALSAAMHRWRTAAARSQRDQQVAAHQNPTSSRELSVNRGLSQLHSERNHETREAESGGPIYRPSLISTVDRWRSAVTQEAAHDQSVNSQQLGSETSRRLLGQFGTSKDQELGSQLSVKLIEERLRERYVSSKSGVPSGPAQKHHMLAQSQAISDDPSTLKRKSKYQPHLGPSTHADAAVGGWEKRMVARATRAREIFLASKVFNHWADRTARRLEREAVARRHMIRFRCFRGWSQVPTSKVPEVDHLRVITATQKLRRAVAQNEEQLRLTSIAASKAYDLHVLEKALDKWSCSVAERTAREKLASRNRKRTIADWLLRARDQVVLDQEVQAQRQQAKEVNSLIRWHGQAERVSMRAAAAAQIGQNHVSFACLRTWWDQAEASRRAQSFRREALARKACFVLDVWNLQARAQAFVWNNEYATVLRVFDRWARKTSAFERLQEEADNISARSMKRRAIDQMVHAIQANYDCGRLQERARFYLGATKALGVLEATAARNKAREKEAVKHYLMARFQQVSRHRKKRNFFSALDRWRAYTAQCDHEAAMANLCKSEHSSQRQILVVDKWSRASIDDQEHHYQARLSRGLSILDIWSGATSTDEVQIAEAQDLWLSEKRRQYQKIWSLSTLQQRGYAHTATVLGQRYDRDRSDKVYKRWKHQCAKGRNVQFDPASAPPKGARSRGSFDVSLRPRGVRSTAAFRNSWKTPSTSKQRFGQETDNLGHFSGLTDTPTRWTGQLSNLDSSTTVRPMPRSNGDEGASSSSAEGAALSFNPLPSINKKPASTLQSTTPRGPVPAYMEPNFRSRLSQLRRSEPGRATPNIDMRPSKS